MAVPKVTFHMRSLQHAKFKSKYRTVKKTSTPRYCGVEAFFRL